MRGVDYLAPHKNACADITDFVKQMEQVPDIRYHRDETVQGIHRQKTIDAVNELYDRAHCDPQPTGTPGVSTFKTLRADVVPDKASMAAPAVVEAPMIREPGPARRAVYHFGSDATAPADSAASSVKRTAVQAITTRRRAVVVGDGTLDAPPPAEPRSEGCVQRTSKLDFGYNYCR